MFFFLKNGLDEAKSQMSPVNAPPPEQNDNRDSGSETQSQRSPDGSEDGDSSQSKSRHISYGDDYYLLRHVTVRCSKTPETGSLLPPLSLLFILGAKCSSWPGDRCSLDPSCNCRGP